MCSIDAYGRDHHSYIFDDGSSSGCCPLPTNSTTKALESLGATIYFIDCWLKLLEHNSIERCHFYTHYMEKLFKNPSLTS